jgi:hypothetical protein
MDRHGNEKVGTSLKFNFLLLKQAFRWITNGTFADYFTTGCKTEASCLSFDYVSAYLLLDTDRLYCHADPERKGGFN